LKPSSQGGGEKRKCGEEKIEKMENTKVRKKPQKSLLLSRKGLLGEKGENGVSGFSPRRKASSFGLLSVTLRYVVAQPTK